MAQARNHNDVILFHRERAAYHLERMLSALEEGDFLRAKLHQEELDAEMGEVFAIRQVTNWK
ncbi:MAG: hypothetical protein ABI361_09855 [Nitrososphaera sp.]|jgi:hypothetical protein